MIKRVPIFLTTILTFLVVYIFLLYGVPYISMLITNRDKPLPIPGALMGIYLGLTIIGLVVYLISDEARIHEFWTPIASFLNGPEAIRTRNDRILSILRWVVLIAVPLLAGWIVYKNLAPSSNPPSTLRTQHPTIPFEYEKLTNPYRNPDGSVAPEVLAEGRLLYQTNCRPCHGTPADGNGPMAYGFRLRPANFRTEDTIATVIEAYAFWRIKEGGIGLPPVGSPWDSAMPAWKNDLSDEQIWKIIAAEYDLAGVEPRRPEAAPGEEKQGDAPGGVAARGTALGMAAPGMAAPGLAVGISLSGAASGQELVAGSSAALQAQENGKAIYQKWCAACHGDAGDGKGPVAAYLYPRPRDFTTGQFKFRTTASGELPLRSDVISIVRRGVHATAMPEWEGILSNAEIEAVVDYILTSFVPDWGTYDPPVIAIPKPPRVTQAMIDDGKKLYQELQCWKCHGQGGRSDGPSAPTLKDDFGAPIRTTNLTKPWAYKGGSQLVDIFTRFSTGMNGTPMPSFYDVYAEGERDAKLWALSAYVQSLQANQPTETSVVTAKRISGALPKTPDDPAWNQAIPVSFYLTGQVITRPRWQIPSVNAVTIQALHNDQDLAMLVAWDDPFQDTKGGGVESDPGKETYINLEQQPEQVGPFADALAVQFPQVLKDGPQKPYFLLGQAGQPVNIWKWQADGKVGELNAAGFQSELAQQKDSQISASAAWADGRYHLLFTRPLVTGDPNDVQLVPGKFIPIVFQAWDGSNGETGMRMSISSWYSLMLEKPIPVSVYVTSGLVVILIAAAEWALVRQVRKSYRNGLELENQREN